MADIFDWSTTASNNDTADSNINWQEGQLPSTVNNSARMMMAKLATWRQVLNGEITSTGTGSAYVLSFTYFPSSLAAGYRFRFKANHTSSGTATLAVNGTGAKSLKARDGVSITANEILSGNVYEVIYDGTDYIVQNPERQVVTDQLDVGGVTYLGDTIILDGSTLQEIRRDGTGKRLAISGGSSISDGAALDLAGSTAPSPDRYTFTIGGTNVYRMDGVLDSHRFADTSGTAICILSADTTELGETSTVQHDILRSSSSSILGLFGGNVENSGGGLKLWGSTHASAASDFALTSDGVNVIKYDDSDSEIEFLPNGSIHMLLSGNNLVLGQSGNNFVIRQSGSSRIMTLSGGNAVSDGANIRLHGSTETDAGDFEIRDDTTNIIKYDASLGTLDLGSAYSTTGAQDGLTRTATEIRSSRNSTSALTHYRFYNPNGSVGQIRTNGTATDYLTSSDERLKKNFRDFDAVSILDKMNMYEFEWEADGRTAYGPKAQELNFVFPSAVSVGGDNPSQDPWGYDASKLVPILVRAVQKLSSEIEELKGQING